MTAGELQQRLQLLEPTLSICFQFGKVAAAINSMSTDDKDDPHMLCVSNSYLQKERKANWCETFTVKQMQDLLAGIKPTLRLYFHFGEKSDNSAMPIDAMYVNDNYSALCLLNSSVQVEGEEIETYYEPSNEEENE